MIWEFLIQPDIHWGYKAGKPFLYLEGKIKSSMIGSLSKSPIHIELQTGSSKTYLKDCEEHYRFLGIHEVNLSRTDYTGGILIQHDEDYKYVSAVYFFDKEIILNLIDIFMKLKFNKNDRYIAYIRSSGDFCLEESEFSDLVTREEFLEKEYQLHFEEDSVSINFLTGPKTPELEDVVL